MIAMGFKVREAEVLEGLEEFRTGGSAKDRQRLVSSRLDGWIFFTLELARNSRVH